MTADKKTANKTLFSSFTCLNVTQFCSALNDNVYKLLLIFMLISIKGPGSSNLILSVAGFVFVLPFLLFSTYCGVLADRFSKRSLVYITRVLEIIIVSLGIVAIALKSALFGYAVLFCLAAQSTIFSPAKYGIIPEIVKREDISKANGTMTATTYLAIILGTFLGSFLSDITNRNFVLASLFCIFTALVGAFFSLGIRKTQPQATEKKSNPFFLIDLYKTLREAKKIRYLVSAIIFSAFFLFMGAYAQLNMIPFAHQSLGLSEIQGGYLFVVTSVGIGLGSFLIGKILGNDCELSFVPISMLLMSFVMMGLYLFQHSLIAIVFLMIFLGMLGGFFIVPIDIYIQIASPNKNRGQNVAAANFLSFGGVLIAATLIFLFGEVLKLSAAQGFFYLSFITFFFSIILILSMLDQVLRLFVALIAKWFWKITIFGKPPEFYKKQTLLLCSRQSWLDTVVMMAILPRRMLYIVPKSLKKKHHFLYRFFALIPLDTEHFSDPGEETLNRIKTEIELGHSLCFMYPSYLSQEALEALEKEINQLIQEFGVPSIWVKIDHESDKSQNGYIKQYFSLFTEKVNITYGEEQQTS